MRGLAVIAAFACSLVLSGCSDSGIDVSSVAKERSAPAHPWADLIKSTRDEAHTDAEREALSDGVISDQEYAYFQEQIVSCLRDLGVTATWQPDKTLSYSGPKTVTQDQINRCNEENGLSIIALRDAILRNPQQLDESQILVDCLKRAGAVDSSFTPERLESGNGIGSVLSSPEFDKCNADPLGYKKRK